LTGGLGAFSGVRVIGPEDPAKKCAVAALDFPAMDNASVSARLDEEFGIMTRCGLHCSPVAHKALGTFPRGVVRCSLGHLNTEAEVDAFLGAMGKILNGK
jgi:selenocysteine lyase/cysteine desulfurase